MAVAKSRSTRRMSHLAVGLDLGIKNPSVLVKALDPPERFLGPKDTLFLVQRAILTGL